jgi:hypothetical protein
MNNTQSIQFILEYLDYNGRLIISRVGNFQKRMVIKYNIVHQNFQEPSTPENSDEHDSDENRECAFECMNENLASPFICGSDDCERICCSNKNRHPYTSHWKVCQSCDLPMCGVCAMEGCGDCEINDLYFCKKCHDEFVSCDYVDCCFGSICHEDINPIDDGMHPPYTRCDVCRRVQFVKHMEFCPVCFTASNDMEMHMYRDHGESQYMDSIKNYVHPLCASKYYMSKNPKRTVLPSDTMLTQYSDGAISLRHLISLFPNYECISWPETTNPRQ